MVHQLLIHPKSIPLHDKLPHVKVANVHTIFIVHNERMEKKSYIYNRKRAAGRERERERGRIENRSETYSQLDFLFSISFIC